MTAMPNMIAGKPPSEPPGEFNPLSTAALVRRVTFGLTPSELTLANALGREAYIERHLNPQSIPDPTVQSRLASQYSWLSLPAPQLTGFAADQLINRLVDARILRAALSERQLFERVVDMWTDHFNIFIQNGPEPVMKVVDDREVIRAHALGRFHDLLLASAYSPAMIHSLDNVSNQFGTPNENYARELLELHTMGANGGYTQHDVREIARCFTGWAYYGGFSGDISYTFFYNPGSHDNGQKIVLGNIIPANLGIEDGHRVVQILAGHPSTARHIARKLLVEFWGYDPPARLIGDIARVYTRTGGDIRAMIRAILDPSIWPSPTPKFKRPLHLVASILRAVGTLLVNAGAMREPLAAAGHLPFHWAPPNGYPDRLSAWAGSLLVRWNFASDLTSGVYNTSASFLPTALFGLDPSPQSIVQTMNQMLHGGEMPAPERAALLQWIGPAPVSETRLREALGLAFSMPSFQWY
ncbi:MAG: DUF1800 domain-containing protein [Phycisphaeraceae bacterium]|nr:DUF1800 domain-containing protein [Phycisphaeraceae bacterium]